ncbi:MAG: 3-phosphoserine/phosphohydroxythreonine transaminase [Kangiellaceae bacterium]
MSDTPTYNFCAGPAGLPKAVLERAQAEMLDWQGLGASVMEISHRSAEYQALAKKAEADFRELLNIGDSHAVLFLHGGATQQFSNIPMTLLSHSDKEAEYLSNGVWSEKAVAEAKRFGKVNSIDVVRKDENGHYYISDLSDCERSQSPIYTHYTPNETIEGFRISQVPKTTGAVIADLSSTILSEQLNLNDYDMIYAGAQKNIGPAGMTVVIIKKSLFEKMHFDKAPTTFNYQLQAEKESMLNTPATYSWYLASLVFEWLKEQGGVAQMEANAIEKSELLYNLIDKDDFYLNPVAKQHRSRMNVRFALHDESLNELFLNKAKQANLIGLKGHRSIGGMRASIYNAVSVEGVRVLVDFMQLFKKNYG